MALRRRWIGWDSWRRHRLDQQGWIQARDSALQGFVRSAESTVGEDLPGSGATSLGASFSGAARSTWIGSSRDGAMIER